MQKNFSKLREQSGRLPRRMWLKSAASAREPFIVGKTVSQNHSLCAIEKLTEIAKAANAPKVMVTPTVSVYRFIRTGIGGFRKAFDAIGGKCVFTSEWDKACRTTYQANYVSDHLVEGDIREFTRDEASLEKIPAHDVLVAGFLCQPFSIAGVSKKNAMGRAHGFRCETQGTLFFDLAQIIEYHRPPVILLENVKNLLSHDSGKTFKVIKKTLEEELGYNIHYRIIDGQHWVPQHRERIFIVGFKDDTSFDFKTLEIPDASLKPTLSSILHKTDGSEAEELPWLVNAKVANKYTLTERLWEYLKGYKEKHQAAGNGFGFGLFGPNDVARTLSARYYKDGSEILIKQKGKRPRRLTPRECARIMGFDRPAEASFQIPVSDTQAYRQFGNSVIVPAAEAVAQLMKPHIIATILNNPNQLSIPFKK